MNEQTFSDRLKTAMQRKQFKQIDLVKAAEAAGIRLGKSHISQYVSGKTIPRDAALSFLAQTLGCDKEWLKSGAESASEPVKSSISNQKEPVRRLFTKSHKLDNVLYDVRGPVVDEANRMEAEGMEILKLSIGNPAPFDFRTPHEIIQDMSSLFGEYEAGMDPQETPTLQTYDLSDIEEFM